MLSIDCMSCACVSHCFLLFGIFPLGEWCGLEAHLISFLRYNMVCCISMCASCSSRVGWGTGWVVDVGLVGEWWGVVVVLVVEWEW